MATNMFTDSTAVDGSIGFGFAPPPQTLVDDVQITFDTEMMDEDEALALQQQQQAPPPPTVQPNAGIGIGGIGGEEVRLVDATGDMGMEMGMDTDTVQVVAEKIHLRGVDTMATGDIEHWERKWVGDGGGLKRVEWIDDSSCNLIYQSASHASNALNHLTDPNPISAPGLTQPTTAQEADLLLIRHARPCEAYSDARLEVRIARVDDVKQKGARERSRFYLFNPEYDRGEEYERRRRDRRNPPRRDRDGDLSTADSDRDYQRRPYDRHEHERRTGTSGDASMYDDTMYDDDPTSTSSSRRRRGRNPGRSRDRRSHSRSRSRSRYTSHSDRRWRTRTRSRTRSPPPPPPRDKATIELFPEVLAKERKVGLMAPTGEYDAFYNPPVEVLLKPANPSSDSLGGGGGDRIPTRAMKGIELFPGKASSSRTSGPGAGVAEGRGGEGGPVQSFLGLAATTSVGTSTSRPYAGKELFPDRLGPSASKSGLEARISLPGGGRLNPPSSSDPSPFLGGILSYHNKDDEIVSKKKATKSLEDDLFAEKMAMGRRVGLGGLEFTESGSGSRGGRNGGDLMDRIEMPGTSGSTRGPSRGRRRAADMFG